MVTWRAGHGAPRALRNASMFSAFSVWAHDPKKSLKSGGGGACGAGDAAVAAGGGGGGGDAGAVGEADVVATEGAGEADAADDGADGTGEGDRLPSDEGVNRPAGRAFGVWKRTDGCSTHWVPPGACVTHFTTAVGGSLGCRTAPTQ